MAEASQVPKAPAETNVIGASLVSGGLSPDG
jgi:hypothetical protein